MKTKELLNEYIKILSSFYPGRGSIWGIKHQFLGNYSNSAIQDTLIKLKGMKELVQNNVQNTNERIIFLKSIDLRIFELEELKILVNKPQFYVQASFDAISINWRMFDYVKHRNIDHDVLRERFKCFVNFFEVAQANLESNELSKIDCIHALNLLNKEEKETISNLNNFVDLDNIEIVEKKIDEFRKFLKNEIAKSQNLINPLGKFKLEKYIELETGIKVDLDKYYEDLKVAALEIKKDIKDLDFSKSPKMYSTRELKEIYSKLIKLGSPWFGGEEEYLNALDFINAKDMLNNKVAKIGYICDDRLLDNQNGGVYVYNPDKIYEYDVELGLVHEGYPGHHYTSMINKVHISNKNILSIHKNLAFDEGWAKYCEHFYAMKLLKDKPFSKIFKTSLFKSIILTIASIEIHSNRKSITRTVDELIKYTNMHSNMLKFICIQAYLQPVYNMSYLLGFLFFKNYVEENCKSFEKNDLRKIHEEIVNEGPILMEGVEYEEFRIA